MLLDLRQLVILEPALLAEHRVRKGELADVVQPTADPKWRQSVLPQPSLSATSSASAVTLVE